MDPIVYAFLSICNEEGNTATIEGIRNKAFQKILTGEVKTLITSSLNGKSYSFNVSKPADILFTQTSQAIRLYNKGIITSTTMDFQWL